MVVNAAGVWADEVRALDEQRNPHSHPAGQGHPHHRAPGRFPCDIAAVIPVREDRRSIFVVSWGGPGLPRDHRHRLGRAPRRSELPARGRRLRPRRRQRHHHQAHRPPTTSPASGPGCGPCSPPGRAGARPSERTADLSRRHTVRISPDGMVTVTGGKLTTYRKMAEDTVDAALQVLRTAGRSLHHQDAAPARGHHPGGRGSDRPDPSGAGVGQAAGDGATAVAAHLAGRYGTETPAVLAVADGRPELLEPLVARTPLPGRRGRLRRRGGDGPLRRRRARPADPGLPARCPGRRPTPPAGWPTSSAPAGVGRPPQPSRRPTPTPAGPGRPGPGRARSPTPARTRPAVAHGTGPRMTRPTPVTPIDAAARPGHRPPRRHACRGRRRAPPTAGRGLRRW